jgi:hypothetical protein
MISWVSSLLSSMGIKICSPRCVPRSLILKEDESDGEHQSDHADDPKNLPQPLAILIHWRCGECVVRAKLKKFGLFPVGLALGH